MDNIKENLAELLEQIGVQNSNMDLAHRIVIIFIILLIAFVADWFCRKVLVQAIKRVAAKTKTKWDDYLFDDKVLASLCHLIPPVIVYILIPFAFPGEHVMLAFILKLCWVYIVAVVMRFICVFLTSLYRVTNEHEKMRDRPLKGVYQMVKLMVISVGCIIIISTLIDKNPATILTGIGASAAILMLVFKDTIMGLVSGVQLSANDMLRPGDWISMPKYGADGSVIEVTLTTVKVRNWDNTISTIPPYSLVSDSFQNWRGMQESGGRRVKRALNIDMTTVSFCNSAQIEKFKEQDWFADFDYNGNEIVNLHVFRHYLEHYLRHHSKIKTDMMIMVRQLQPTSQGLPIELYFFSDGVEWIPYERLQAEVFDHVLAVLSKFDLRVFQSPTGADWLALGLK